MTVRHAPDDRIVAVVDIVIPNNKQSNFGQRAYLKKVSALIQARVHLLLIDLFPSIRNDRHRLHSAIWDELTGDTFEPPADKRLSLVAYENGLDARSFLESVVVGDSLIDMPLFLEPGKHVLVPLQSTYQTVWAKFPDRWRRVVAPGEID